MSGRGWRILKQDHGQEFSRSASMSLRNQSQKRFGTRELRALLEEPGTVFLDDASQGQGHSLLFRRPVRQIIAQEADDLTGVLADVDAAIDDGYWAAGYLTYEAGEALMGLTPRGEQKSLAWFGVYEQPEEVRVSLDNPKMGDARLRRLEPDRAEYGRMFQAVKAHIREGDVYQINLTGRARLDIADPFETYALLRMAQPVPFGAFLNTDRTIMSFSPERFFRIDGRKIAARPMKGTAPRGTTEDKDSEIGRRLSLDPKNRAENLMIVDLLRNDLSVVCEPGSVVVPSLFNVERHPTLWQMTSDIEGELREGAGLGDVLEALFPCGSITGAPKRRAMEIIREIESWPRGVYCGAIGYASPHGVAEFNVAIRTIEIGEEAVMGTGSGLVWDSEADAEYEELRLKTRFAVTEGSYGPALLETILFDGSEVVRKHRHLERLEASASELGFSYDRNRVEAAIEERIADRTEAVVLRVSLRKSGAIEIELSEQRYWASQRPRVVVSDVVIDSSDPLLRHKTTDRRIYEQALNFARQNGADEGLLTNERGEITEGSFTNVFAVIEGVMYTPPLDSGVLPGILRSELIAKGAVRERVLYPSDLESAESIHVGNSVRGLRRAEFIRRREALTRSLLAE
jgi:para-aminobenzoate synthetase / 4-amino-4-deoxychorismate lyase